MIGFDEKSGKFKIRLEYEGEGINYYSTGTGTGTGTGAGAYTADGRVGEYTRVGGHVLLVRGEDFEYFPDVGLDAKAEKHGQGSK